MKGRPIEKDSMIEILALEAEAALWAVQIDQLHPVEKLAKLSKARRCMLTITSLTSGLRTPKDPQGAILAEIIEGKQI